MKFLASIILVFGISISTLAQETVLDSLLREVENAQHDTTKALLYSKMGRSIYMSDPDSAVYYFDLSIGVSNRLANQPDVSSKVAKSIKARALKDLGIAYYLGDKYDNAIQACQESIEIYNSIEDKLHAAGAKNVIGVVQKKQGNYDEAEKIYQEIYAQREELGRVKIISFAANNLGMIRKEKGQLKEAQEYYLISMEIKNEIGDIQGVGSTSNNIGLVYHAMEEYDKALEYFRKALSADIKSESMRGLAGVYNNIGNLYQDIGQSDSVLYYYRKALNLKIRNNDKHGSASTMNNIGAFYLHFSDTLQRRNDEDWKAYMDSARYYVSNALEIREELGDQNGIASCLNNLGGIEIAFGSQHKAIEYCSRAYDIAIDIEAASRELASCNCLRQAYEKTGQLAKAYPYFRRYVALNDSLTGLETSKEIAEQVLQNEYRQKRMRDSLDQVRVEEKREMEAKRKKLVEEQERERIMALGIGGGIVGLVLIISLVVTIRGLRAKKRANSMLEEKNTVILEQKSSVENQKKEIEEQKDIIEEKNKEVLDSIQYARKIQSAILPSQDHFNEIFQDGFVFFKPRDIVSGDFYWMREVDGAIYVAVADCTGHGVPGAFVSLVGHNGLNRTLTEFGLRKPGEILDKLNELVEADFASSDKRMSDGMDIAMVKIGGNGEEGGENVFVEFAGANNPLWITSSSGSKTNLSEIKADKQPIGKFAERKNFSTHNVELNKGDQIYLFSDGFQDQFGGNRGKKYKSGPFREFIMNISELSMADQYKKMDAEFERWRGQIEQIDDVCVIGIRV